MQIGATRRRNAGAAITSIPSSPRRYRAGGFHRAGRPVCPTLHPDTKTSSVPVTESVCNSWVERETGVEPATPTLPTGDCGWIDFALVAWRYDLLGASCADVTNRCNSTRLGVGGRSMGCPTNSAGKNGARLDQQRPVARQSILPPLFCVVIQLLR